MKFNHNSPIGIFDSGIGGLSILNGIKKLLPNEQLVYIADTAYAPYGEKNEKHIIERSEKIVQYLLQLNVKAVVIACNTATAIAVDKLREKVKVPIVAIEPAVKIAVRESKNNKIGVIATRATLQSKRFNDLMVNEQKHTNIYTQIGYGLVEEIERFHQDPTFLDELLAMLIEPLKAKDIDSLVLGCTHYPLVKSHIKKQLDKKVLIIEPSLAVVKQLKRILSEKNALHSQKRVIESLFFTTGNKKQLQFLVNKYYLFAVQKQQISIKKITIK